MKHITLYLLFLTSILVHNAQAQNKKKHSAPFDLNGVATVYGKPAGNYELTLYYNGEIVETFYVTKASPVTFELESNRVYSLVYEKGAFPDKIVIINTEVPQDIKNIGSQVFHYEVELAPRASTQKKEMEDYPVAYVFYHTEEKKLVFSSKYHNDSHKGDINPLNHVSLNKKTINQY